MSKISYSIGYTAIDYVYESVDIDLTPYLAMDIKDKYALECVILDNIDRWDIAEKISKTCIDNVWWNEEPRLNVNEVWEEYLMLKESKK